MSETQKRGMKSKTIKSILRRKVDAWLDSIEDEKLRGAAKRDAIVTGGAIASMLTGEPISDFDIYFKTFTTTLAIAHYYVDKFKPTKKKGIDVPLSVLVEDRYEKAGVVIPQTARIRIVAKSAGIASEAGTDKPYEYFESVAGRAAEDYVASVIQDPEQIEDTYQETEELAKATTTTEPEKKKYRAIFLTTNAITLSDSVQLIIRFYGEPEEIHANYDFVHCTNYWTSGDSNLVLRPEALEALLSRTLNYVGSKYPICSLVRVRKFVGRGWQINAGQLLKMAMQIGELNLKDIKVLEDQLTGVDTAYFLELIEKLKEKDPEKVDSAYLVEIINRIF